VARTAPRVLIEIELDLEPDDEDDWLSVDERDLEAAS